jgi:Fic family protein
VLGKQTLNSLRDSGKNTGKICPPSPCYVTGEDSEYTGKESGKMTSIAAMEPMLPDGRREIEDLIFDLVARSSQFRGRLNPVMRASIGDLVRSMNCYYSNLIEGHNTTPFDIDRALAGEYSQEPRKRNLQREARAHIEVQEIIDRGEMPYSALSVEAILWIHKEFCARLPDELLWVNNPATGEKLQVIPGELRKTTVKVGRHVPPEPDTLHALLGRLVEAYSSRMLSKSQRMVAIAAAHHRLAWIHPFLDGNGRVTRLMSHALLRELGVGAELWSVSRGLAREVDRYKALLEAADEPRRGDLDGRGNLTERGLSQFCEFFLVSCVDQVKFMDALLEPTELLNRMEIWAEEEIRAKRLLKGSWPLLREAVLVGDFGRAQAEALTGYQERQARTVLTALLDKGLLVSDSPRSKVRLGFPVEVFERWLPRLYPAAR